MKITKVDVYMLDAGEQRWQRKPIICRIHTDEGVYGDGEAGIALGIGSTGAFGMVKDLAGLIIGMDPMNIEVIWNKMFKSSFWGMGGGAIVFAGISAIDIALWDIKGRSWACPATSSWAESSAARCAPTLPSFSSAGATASDRTENLRSTPRSPSTLWIRGTMR